MLNRMCSIEPGECAKAAVRKRHGSVAPRKGTNARSLVTRGDTRCRSHTATQMTMIARVTTGRPPRVTLAPNSGGTEERYEREVVGHQRRHPLQEPYGHTDDDDRQGDHRPAAPGDLGTELRARHTHALLALADTVDALDADRGRLLTLRAGRPAAALAAHIRNPIGVPWADRLRLVWRGLTHAKGSPIGRGLLRNR